MAATKTKGDQAARKKAREAKGPGKAKKFGRPNRAFSREICARILGRIAAGDFRYQAAQACSITDRTLRNWIERGQTNVEAVDKAEHDGAAPVEIDAYGEFFLEFMATEANVEAAALNYIREDPDWRARAWYLERRKPREYASPAARVQMVADGDEGPVDAVSQMMAKIDEIRARGAKIQSGDG